MSKETKFKFVIQQNGKELELTLEEAEKLYNDLKKIFGRENETIWPNPIPYSPPSIPQNPWTTPSNPDWPGQPWKLPDTIICRLDWL